MKFGERLVTTVLGGLFGLILGVLVAGLLYQISHYAEFPTRLIWVSAVFFAMLGSVMGGLIADMAAQCFDSLAVASLNGRWSWLWLVLFALLAISTFLLMA